MKSPQKIFNGLTWVGWLNYLFLQFFFIRFFYNNENEWGILYKVKPLTGWGTPYNDGYKSRKLKLRLWFVQQWKWNVEQKSWHTEIQGIFFTKKRAIAACWNCNYEVLPLYLGYSYPDETVKISGSFYPLNRQNKGE